MLGPTAVGYSFEDLYGGPNRLETFDASIEELMSLGSQTGWFGGDETVWRGIFDRVGDVRANAMKRLGNLVDSDNHEARVDLFRDLHGLVATATALYEAADVDVVVDLRVPDIHQLRAAEHRIDGFLTFLQKTVTKSDLPL